MTVNPRRRGRPSRAAASVKAMGSLPVDPQSINPKAILAGIAADPSAPATARVQACRVLLGHPGDSEDEVGADDLTVRAITLLRRRADH
jgi:hypothetical protein